MPKAKIDRRLRQQLDDAEQTGRARGAANVQAVFALAGSADAPPSREQTQRTVDAVLTRARAASGAAPTDVNTFSNLGRFVVAGPPEFLRAVAAQPEVSAAIANRPSSSMRIGPPPKRSTSPKARSVSKRRSSR